MVLVFEQCELDLDRVELRVGGQPRPVEPQVFDVLAHLVQHRHRLVPREELLDEVWHSRFVTDSAISSRIKSARRAIGDDGVSQRLIRTVHGRGYQFVGEVRSTDPELAPHAVVPSVGAVPAQLPLSIPAFTGRMDQVDRLDALLSDQGGEPGGSSTVLCVVSGTAGVGKTALAVHWAHRVADRFPDGQLYVNLRGFDVAGSVVDPAEAVRGFLGAFQVPAGRIPAGLADSASLYRSVLAGKRVLVVLDNARDTEQVRLLLPGSAGCLVIITSRNRLTPLVATEGAVPLPLDLMTVDEARDLLTRRLGAARVGTDPDAVDELIGRCVRLPLALAITAARAATNPALPLAALVAELAESEAALDVFAGGDPSTDIRVVLSWSYHALTSDAARLFRLLAVHPGPEISAAAAASLAGVAPQEAKRQLAELSSASLLTERSVDRYVVHDLLRAYAAERLDAADSAAEQEAALHRLLDHYLWTAHPVALLLQSHFDRIELPACSSGVTAPTFRDPEQARDWLIAELPALLAAAHLAGHTGHPTHAWQLAWALSDSLERYGHWQDWYPVAESGLRAATGADDKVGQAHAHRDLARACSRLGRREDAWMHICQALELFEEVGDDAGRAPAYLTVGQLLERRGDIAEALEQSSRALELFRAAGHQRGEAYTLNAIGWQHALLGQYAEAVEFCSQAIVRLRAIGDVYGQADTWDSLGYAHHGLGEYQQAIRCYETALRLYEAHMDRFSVATTLNRLGDSHRAADDLEAAHESWQRAITILDELADPGAEPLRSKLRALPCQPA